MEVVQTSNEMENSNSTRTKQTVPTSENSFFEEENFESSILDQSRGQVVDNKVTSTGNEIQCVRRRSRQRNAPIRYGDPINLPENIDILLNSTRESDPTTYDEAIESKNSEQWIDAMKNEMESLNKQKVRELVERPKNSPIIQGKWFLQQKEDLMVESQASKQVLFQKAAVKSVEKTVEKHFFQRFHKLRYERF